MKVEGAIDALTDHAVEFIVIGGWAAVIYNSAYVTTDLDICFSRSLENRKRLVKALAPLHPRLRDLPPDLPFVWDEATLNNATILTLDTDLGKIDLLAEVPGLGTFDDIRPNAQMFELFKRQVWTLDIQSLIKSKRVAGRPKDLAVVMELEGLIEAQED